MRECPAGSAGVAANPQSALPAPGTRSSSVAGPWTIGEWWDRPDSLRRPAERNRRLRLRAHPLRHPAAHRPGSATRHLGPTPVRQGQAQSCIWVRGYRIRACPLAALRRSAPPLHLRRRTGERPAHRHRCTSGRAGPRGRQDRLSRGRNAARSARASAGRSGLPRTRSAVPARSRPILPRGRERRRASPPPRPANFPKVDR